MAVAVPVIEEVLEANIMNCAICTAAEDIAGSANKEDMFESAIIEDMAACTELCAEFVGEKVASIDTALGKEVIEMLVVVLKEMVGVLVA